MSIDKRLERAKARLAKVENRVAAKEEKAAKKLQLKSVKAETKAKKNAVRVQKKQELAKKKNDLKGVKSQISSTRRSGVSSKSSSGSTVKGFTSPTIEFKNNLPQTGHTSRQINSDFYTLKAEKNAKAKAAAEKSKAAAEKAKKDAQFKQWNTDMQRMTQREVNKKRSEAANNASRQQAEAKARAAKRNKAMDFYSKNRKSTDPVIKARLNKAHEYINKYDRNGNLVKKKKGGCK